MHQPLASRDALLDPAEVDARVARDIVLLESAGRQWRWLGWLWYFGGVILSVPLMLQVMVLGLNQNNLRPMIVAGGGALLVLAIFFGIGSLYFFLARRLTRGRRWAVGVALFLAALATAVTGTRIVIHVLLKRGAVGPIITDTLLLLAHLNLVRLLFQSYSAARRLRYYASLRLEADELHAPGRQP
jgi:hypothetical protein